MFEFLKPHPMPTEDVRIELPAVSVVFNHRTKTAFLFADDSQINEATLSGLEAHLKKRGYFLQVFVAAPSAMIVQRE